MDQGGRAMVLCALRLRQGMLCSALGFDWAGSLVMQIWSWTRRCSGCPPARPCCG